MGGQGSWVVDIQRAWRLGHDPELPTSCTPGGHCLKVLMRVGYTCACALAPNHTTPVSANQITLATMTCLLSVLPRPGLCTNATHATHKPPHGVPWRVGHPPTHTKPSSRSAAASTKTADPASLQRKCCCPCNEGSKPATHCSQPGKL